MNKKIRIGLIIFALLSFVVVSTATTVYISSVEEGRNLLGTSQNTELIGCKVYSIQKIAIEEKDLDGDWTVTFALEYNREDNGKMIRTREGVKTVKVSNDSETTIKNAVEPICDNDWETAKTKHGTITKIIINPTNNPILNQIYNPASKIWSNSISTG